MDKYLDIELDSWGLSVSGAQGYFSISYLGIGIAILSVVCYKIYKYYRKDK